MASFQERVSKVIRALMMREDLALDSEKLRSVENHLNQSVDGALSSCGSRHLEGLEKLSSISKATFKPLVDKINGQLDVLVKILEEEKSPTLTTVISGLYTVFVSLLNPAVSNYTRKTMETFSIAASHVHRVNLPEENLEYLNRYKLWIRPVCEEKKQQFINELMYIPFSDAVETIQNSKDENTSYIVRRMLEDNENGLVKYLESRADLYGFRKNLQEFFRYFLLRADDDCCTDFNAELADYVNTQKDIADSTLEGFFKSYPHIRESIFVDELDMENFLPQFERLFVEYCRRLRVRESIDENQKRPIIESDILHVEPAEVSQALNANQNESSVEAMTQATEKKQPAQDLDASDERFRSETNPSSCNIGVHNSPDVKIKFILSNATIQAKVSHVDGLVPVELPEIHNQYNASSETAKLKQLLRNFHFRPVYQAEPSKKVSFQSVTPEQKTWEKGVNALKLPDDSVWICRRNGTISYAYANSVTTWDWNTDTFAVASYQTTKITALAESEEGQLIMGDQQGNLFISNQILPTGTQKEIKNIFPFFNAVLAKFDHDDGILFDLDSKQPIITPNANTQKFRVLDNTMVVTWDTSEMNIFKYNPNKKQYEQLPAEGSTDISDILAIPNAKFLVVHADKTGTLWDVRKEPLSSRATSKVVSLIAKRNLGENLLVLDRKTLVYEARSNGNKVQLGFYRQAENGPASDDKADVPGNWSVTSMISLSDGSIMYATDARGSGIHIITSNRNIVFTKEVRQLLADVRVHLLKELSDGSVAVQCAQSIFILKPQMVDMAENVDYQTELSKLSLEHNPYDLELYSKLAELYVRKSDQTNEELYQLYLSGLEAATKSDHLYEARRFYEKARKIKANSKEPCEMFLFYLEITPYEQLKRRVQLDLYALTKTMGGVLTNLKDRKCKARLLIGEGDFSFTEALVNKHQDTHPNLSKAITATDLIATHLKPPETQKEADAINQLKKRILDLQKRGVDIRFGVDATEIHRIFKSKRFKRIQWNCLFGEANPTAREEFKKIIPHFFQSCSQLQLPGDRVHVTLMQKSDDFWKTRQKENPIVLGSAKAGYRLIRKRSFLTFGKKRYPGYVHVKTGSTEMYTAGGEEQEFIFEKTDQVLSKSTLKKAQKLIDPQKKNYKIDTDDGSESNCSLEDCYFICSTDEDSSDYYESDSDE